MPCLQIWNGSGQVTYGVGLPHQGRSFRREAAQMHLLLQDLLASAHVGAAHPHSHRGTTLQVSPVPQRLQAEPTLNCSHGQYSREVFQRNYQLR